MLRLLQQPRERAELPASGRSVLFTSETENVCTWADCSQSATGTWRQEICRSVLLKKWHLESLRGAGVAGERDCAPDQVIASLSLPASWLGCQDSVMLRRDRARLSRSIGTAQAQAAQLRMRLT